jgi:hypothetical protein
LTTHQSRGSTRVPCEEDMSDTSKTEKRRDNKKRAAGKDRKKKLEKHGTTPAFPIHPQG